MMSESMDWDVNIGLSTSNLLTTPPQHIVVSPVKWIALTQVYLDVTDRADRAGIDERRVTGDLDFQHRLPVGARHDVVWGLGYRITRDDIDPTFFVDVDKRRKTDHLLSLFVHDEVAVRADELRMTVGAKLERNSYSGLELQPNARLAWTPTKEHTVWGSVARAVRTPARGESGQSITIAVSPPGDLLVDGVPTRTVIENDEPIDPDKLLAFELGWRSNPREGLLLDAVAFHNRYEDVLTFEFGAPYREGVDQPYTVLPLHLNNDMEARAQGIELFVDWQAAHWWRTRSSYSFLDKEIENPNPRLAMDAEMGDPRHQATHWSTLTLSSRIDLNAVARYVDEIPSQRADKYLELDLRLEWCPEAGLCLSAGGRNLLQGDQLENVSGFQNVLPTRAHRVVFADARWRFGAVE